MRTGGIRRPVRPRDSRLLDRFQQDRAEVHRLVAAAAGHLRHRHHAAGRPDRLVSGMALRIGRRLVDDDHQVISAGLDVLDPERAVAAEHHARAIGARSGTPASDRLVGRRCSCDQRAIALVPIDPGRRSRRGRSPCRRPAGPCRRRSSASSYRVRRQPGPRSRR